MTFNQNEVAYRLLVFSDRMNYILEHSELSNNARKEIASRIEYGAIATVAMILYQENRKISNTSVYKIHDELRIKIKDLKRKRIKKNVHK